MSNTPKLDLPEIAEAQASKYITHNEALRVLDAVVQCNVLSKTDIVPPGSPTDGDTYIVGIGTDSNSGDWDGHDSEIAYYKSSSWVFILPAEGWRSFSQDDGIMYSYRPTKVASGEDPWIHEPGSHHVLHEFIEGEYVSEQVVFSMPLHEPFLFHDNLEGSVGHAEVAATAGKNFDILKNGVSFATMTFASGQDVATFATSGGEETFAIGDVFKIVAPVAPDASLADISFAIVGVVL